ncbi:unnamed protein product [Diatraea saccharalis]|uniref:Uncharacterized protein n=1 Tax=Diatraea saccharalis TaxID=40085 RepID=A0A9N9R658_9NEOP|nr:unnamed protein product [Diatraea saccharalis]
MDDTAHNITEECKVDLALELRSFRNELKAELKDVRNEIHECRIEISEFKTALSAFDVKMSELESRLSTLETKCAQVMPENVNTFEENISHLKAQLNNRDQELLLNDIDLSGIPEQNGENLSNIVIALSTKLGITYEERDIVRVERVGSVRRNRVERSANDDLNTLRPRTIVVRFVRRLTRDQWLRATCIRRNLTTKDIDVPGKSGNVYVNE